MGLSFARAGDVAWGQEVRAGQPIALSGFTGYTTVPHLHFDVVDVLPQESECSRWGSRIQRGSSAQGCCG